MPIQSTEITIVQDTALLILNFYHVTSQHILELYSGGETERGGERALIRNLLAGCRESDGTSYERERRTVSDPRTEGELTGRT